MKKIQIITNGNKFLEQVLNLVNSHEEIQALWLMANVTAKRLQITDHDIDHFQIVAENALSMQRMLHKRKVRMSLVKDYKLPYESSEVVVLLAA